MKALILVAAAALAGCATPPDPIVVKVPVPVGCLGEVPARPVARFGTGAYPGEKAAAQAALLDSLAFQSYATGLEVAMAGCEGVVRYEAASASVISAQNLGSE